MSPRWRPFRVAAITDESPDCRSFRLEPLGDDPLPLFRGGQSVAVRLIDRRSGQTLVRCYSLSGMPGETHYQITVKRVPGGRASNLLHDRIRIGDTIDLQTPRGDFCIPRDSTARPLVLIAGGIGITPLLAMLLENLEQSPQRPLELHYQLRSPDHAPFRELLQNTLQRLPAHVPTRLHLYYSQPGTCPVEPAASVGRLSVAKILDTAFSTDPTSETEPADRLYLICGPESFNHQLTADLVAAGVPRQQVLYEAFGRGATTIDTGRLVRQANHAASSAKNVGHTHQDPSDINTPLPTVHFAASDLRVTWDPQCDTLLELAEANGLELDSSCRNGDCGACLLKLAAGAVDYLQTPACGPEDDEVVMCLARPSCNIRVDG